MNKDLGRQCCKGPGEYCSNILMPPQMTIESFNVANVKLLWYSYVDNNTNNQKDK